MLSVSSKIWTRSTVSISYDDNHNTTGTSQAGSDSPKTMDSKVVLQAIEVNLASRTQRVSGKFGILQYCVLYHLYGLGRNIRSCWIVSHDTKILLNFQLILKFMGETVCVWSHKRSSLKQTKIPMTSVGYFKR